MLDHAHPVDPERVATARSGALPPDAAASVAARVRLVGDPLRVRIVSALDAAEELCVGDLALALDASDSSVSHALRHLRTSGVVANRRDGRVIYYRLTDTRMLTLIRTARGDAPSDAVDDDGAATPPGGP